MSASVDLKRPLKEEADDDDDDLSPAKKRASPKSASSTQCPYLDTINRHVLDFDFEKRCSVSLSHINVYACLVCGKYFQVIIFMFFLAICISNICQLRAAARTPTPTRTA